MCVNSSMKRGGAGQRVAHLTFLQILTVNFNFCNICSYISDNIESLYAFTYQADVDYTKNYGWDLFDTQTEFLRMGVPNENWVQSNFNKEYDVCTKCLTTLYKKNDIYKQFCISLYNIP